MPDYSACDRTFASNLPSRAEAILNFWFGPPDSISYGQYQKIWFTKDANFDQQIRERFLADYEKAAAGEYSHWLNNPAAGVALILLLDQFPRNLFRGEPRSFATDPQARAAAEHLINTGADQQLIPAQRFFIYVPFEHSEHLDDQTRCVELMEQLNETFPDLDPGLKNGMDYALRHRQIIEQFGRFPHRNEILGRPSTPEEMAFLQQPGSRF